MFSYQWQQVWGLITSVCKSDTSPTLFYLGTSWFESGLSSSVANCPLEGKCQQAGAVVVWCLVGNIYHRTGKSGLSLCCFTDSCPSHSPGSPRLTSGLPLHVPFGFGADMLVAEGWGPNLQAEVLPRGQAVLPFGGGTAGGGRKGILGKSLLPQQIQLDLCE